MQTGHSGHLSMPVGMIVGRANRLWYTTVMLLQSSTRFINCATGSDTGYKAAYARCHYHVYDLKSIGFGLQC